MKLKCMKCGSESVAVARNMIGTRYCGCGHKWDPADEKTYVLERKIVILTNALKEIQANCTGYSPLGPAKVLKICAEAFDEMGEE